MSDPMIDRRNVLTVGGMAAVGAVAFSSTQATAQTPAATAAIPGRAFAPHPVALPFDPNGAKAGDYVDSFMRSTAWSNADKLASCLAVG
jgi:hypothetical protein